MTDLSAQARPRPDWQPLVEYRRNGVAENTIHGAVSWVSGDTLVHSFGGNVECYGRSMLKPQMMKVAITPFAGKLASQLVVSIAAGIRSADIGRSLSVAGATPTATSYGNIVRAMPNTPALIRAGITGLYASLAVGASGRKQAETLLEVVGKIAWFDDEAMLDAVTAVSGSGPAYVFYVLEALEQAAREMGFDELTAREFALQTFLGGARLAAGSAESPAVLRQRVTSKGGTTERAIESFDTFHVREHIIEGVKAAGERSRQLGEEMSAISSGELGCDGKLKGKN